MKPFQNVVFNFVFLSIMLCGCVLRGVDVYFLQGANAAEPESITEFIKVTKENGQPTALYTPVIRYTKVDDDKKIVLDIFGAVHVGDAAYYQTLNQAFTKYEAVLYELVAPDNQLIPEQGQPSTIADLAKAFLKLDHQLKVVDYTAPNFVHADFTHSEMQEAMAKNGDNTLTVAVSFLLEMVRNQNKAAYEAKQNGEAIPQNMPQINPMALLSGDANQAIKIKQMMAEQMSKPDAQLGFGSTIGDYLINQRNDDALATMDETIESGKTRLALFYGAAHIPDFDTKLQKLGFVRGETRWLPAWNNLNPKTQSNEVQQMLQILE